MRLAVISSRLTLVDERGAIDVATVSAGVVRRVPFVDHRAGAAVELPSEAVDYEAELVVVIGERAHRVARQDAWEHVAGLTLGQDLSERLLPGDPIFTGTPAGIGWARDPKVVLRPATASSPTPRPSER